MVIHERPPERTSAAVVEILRCLDLGQVQQWSESVGALGDAEPQVPEELDDRTADGWEALLTVADSAGEQWSRRAREAALVLHANAEDVERTLGVQLLFDLRRLFVQVDHKVLFTDEILRRLNGLDESPWGGFLDGKGINARRLAKMLRPYGVKSRDVRRGKETAKGYRREELTPEWDRYLATPAVAVPEQINPRHRDNAADSGTCDDSDRDRVADQSPPNRAESLRCHGVTDETLQQGGLAQAVADDEVGEL